MKWQDKMDAVVKDVLGEEYACVIKSEHSFQIFENNELIAAAASKCVKAHWRNDLRNTLEIILRSRITKSLLKY